MPASVGLIQRHAAAARPPVARRAERPDGADARLAVRDRPSALRRGSATRVGRQRRVEPADRQRQVAADPRVVVLRLLERLDQRRRRASGRRAPSGRPSAATTRRPPATGGRTRRSGPRRGSPAASGCRPAATGSPTYTSTVTPRRPTGSEKTERRGRARRPAGFESRVRARRVCPCNGETGARLGTSEACKFYYVWPLAVKRVSDGGGDCRLEIGAIGRKLYRPASDRPISSRQSYRRSRLLLSESCTGLRNGIIARSFSPTCSIEDVLLGLRAAC